MTIDTTGLVAYYTFDDATWTDSSGNGNDLAAVGTPPGIVAGRVGNAAEFNNTNNNTQYLQQAVSPPSLNFDTGSFSISAWIKMTTTACLISRIAGAGGYAGWELRIDTQTRRRESVAPLIVSGVLNFYNGSWWTLANTNVVDSKWHHIVLAYDGPSQTMNFYRDNLPDGTRGLPQPSLTTCPGMTIGVRNDLSEPGFAFGGLVDELFIFGRALSPDDVNELYLAGGGPPPPVLIGYDIVARKSPPANIIGAP